MNEHRTGHTKPLTGSHRGIMVESQEIINPDADFPLRRHEASKQFYKTIRQRAVYFGVLSDPETALERYRNFIEGRGKLTNAEVEANKAPGSITLEDGVNQFLGAKLKLVQNNELSSRSLQDYTLTCGRLLRVLGHDRDVATIEAGDLTKLRDDIAKTRGFVAMATELQRSKTFFKWLFDNEKISVPIRTAIALKGPAKKNLRVERNSKPKRMFEAAEIRKMLAVASFQLRAMILLGINAGYGNSDLSELPESAIDFESGYIDYPRSKTGAKRRCPMWPETATALRLAIEKRYPGVVPEAAGKVFVTRWGATFVRLRPNGVNVDSICLEFGKLMRSTKVKLPGERKGLSFYALRHTFETVSSNCRDQVATNLIMGHAEASGDMGAVYREEVADDRLVDVTNYVRKWLWPAGSEAKQVKADARAATQAATEDEGQKPETPAVPKPVRKRTSKK